MRKDTRELNDCWNEVDLRRVGIRCSSIRVGRAIVNGVDRGGNVLVDAEKSRIHLVECRPWCFLKQSGTLTTETGAGRIFDRTPESVQVLYPASWCPQTTGPNTHSPPPRHVLASPVPKPNEQTLLTPPPPPPPLHPPPQPTSDSPLPET